LKNPKFFALDIVRTSAFEGHPCLH